MFGRPGVAYVYLVYGMYDCLNVVTGPDGEPAAVLIRAVEPVEGIDAMRIDRLTTVTSRRRSMSPERVEAERARLATLPPDRLASGPGLVAAAFGLTTALTGADLCDPPSPVRLEPRGSREPPVDIVATPRIGIAYAGEPWVSMPVAVRRPRQPVGLRAEPGPLSPRAAERGQPLPDASRIPGRPRAAGRSDVVPAVAAAGRGARAVGGSRSSWPGASRRPTRRARSSRTDRASGSARHGTSARPSNGRPVAAASNRSNSSSLPTRSTRRRGWRPSSPTIAGRCCTNSRATCTRCLRCARRSHAASIRSASCSIRRRHGWAGSVQRSASHTTGCGGGSTRSSAPSSGNALQEPIVTLRNGRYVVPVKAEARGRVKGIVHDASGSGQTLFIEPLVAVELGNAWREAQVAEAEEIARILDELSAFVAANATALRETLDALARFDLWAAKASLAADMDATRAETADRPEVVLLSARHPGLTGRVVPIDIRLGEGYTALVVTGPNTGGKTVTLRTLGLLSLMHQAGLHIPAAPGSRLPIWQDVFADIGDEQSIAQSLSTFSGHLRSIIRIVDAAGPGTLVLLDELGAGTDPTEGSALAQALLDHFIRAGALVAATTHYAELKAYAHTTPGARNAAVEFDLDTLSPTYRLTIGLPGGSQAFAIAERLGLPETIVDDARSRLTESQRSFEATLAAIRATEGETSEALERARIAERRATDAMRAAEEERRRARRERDEAVRAARAEAERVVSDLRSEVASARESLERETLTEPALDDAVARAERELGRLPELEPVPVAEPVVPTQWRLGDRARSRSGGWEGRIAALERGGKRATLEAGGMRVTVDAADLVPAFDGTGAAVSAGVPGTTGSDGGRRYLERIIDPAGACSFGGVVARPARRACRRGARRAGSLPGRRGAGGPRQGDHHPRPRHRRPPRCRAFHRSRPPARAIGACRPARRRRRRSDDHRALTRPIGLAITAVACSRPGSTGQCRCVGFGCHQLDLERRRLRRRFRRQLDCGVVVARGLSACVVGAWRLRTDRRRPAVARRRSDSVPAA